MLAKLIQSENKNCIDREEAAEVVAEARFTRKAFWARYI